MLTIFVNHSSLQILKANLDLYKRLIRTRLVFSSLSFIKLIDLSNYHIIINHLKKVGVVLILTFIIINKL